MINRNSQVARGVRYALYVSAVATAATSLPALAQDQQEAAAGPSELGTVVVTGSRIPQPNLTSISPVTAVGNEEIKLQGVTRVEDLINNLPQAALISAATVERRNRRSDCQSARPRLAAHTGSGQQPPPDAG